MTNFFFLVLQRLMSDSRREIIQDFLDTIGSWSEEEFQGHLRLSRRTAFKLLDELEASGVIPVYNFGMEPISAAVCFMIFLWFMANTEPLRTIALRFKISIPSVFRIVRRVVSWILTKIDEVIKWPRTPNEIRSTCDDFYEIRNIRNVLGAIDCTHIRINKPSRFVRQYMNRKRYCSINLQAVVDAKMRFTNVYCGEPGSYHDTRVLRRSAFYDEIRNHQNQVFPNNTFLLGDSGYPLLPWLITPFRDNGHLTPQQTEFNFRHSSTRMTVERAFGLMKARFRRIKFFTEYTDLPFVTRIITAACILHNYCINSDDEFQVPEEDDDGDNDDNEDDDGDNNNDGNNNGDNNDDGDDNGDGDDNDDNDDENNNDADDNDNSMVYHNNTRPNYRMLLFRQLYPNQN